MQKLQITHNADYSEYIAENGNERTVMYVRKYSTVIVKERGSEMLECASFGEGPMQKFRDVFKGAPANSERDNGEDEMSDKKL